MKYICDCQSLKLKNGKTAKFGDPVPEASDWPENIIRSNLRLGYIREDKPAKTGSSHAVETRMTTTVLSPAQLERRDAAPAWLLAEAEKGRDRNLLPDQKPAEDDTLPGTGGVTLSANQGPHSSATLDPGSGDLDGDSDTAESTSAPEPNRQRNHNKKRGR